MEVVTNNENIHADKNDCHYHHDYTPATPLGGGGGYNGGGNDLFQ